MPIIQCNLSATDQAVSNWNALTGATSTGTKIASGSVVNSVGGVVSGVAISVTDAWSTESDGSGFDVDTYPAGVENTCWQLGDGVGAVSGNVVFSGLGAGTATVTVYGNRDLAAARIANIVITGQGGSTDSGTLSPETGGATTQATRTFTADPVTLGVSDSLTVAVTTDSADYTHISAIIVDFTAGGGASGNIKSNSMLFGMG